MSWLKSTIIGQLNIQKMQEAERILKQNVYIFVATLYSLWFEVRKRAKIRNRYNQPPHLTQDTNGKVTTSQINITIESQEVSPFTADDHKAFFTDVHESITKQGRNNINDPQKKHRLGTISKNILLEGLNRFSGAPTSPLVQMWIKTHRCLVCTKDP